MARGPDKQFDPETALRQAMDLFWAKGYASTSVSELQATLGIGRKSLYDTFGDKRSLFLKAVELYASDSRARVREVCRSAPTPLEGLHALLQSFGERYAEGDSNGCLVGISMAQFRTDDPEMCEALRANLQAVVDPLQDAIRAAQEAGQIDREQDARSLTFFLISLLQGMALLARVHEDPELSRGIAKSARSFVRSLEC